jgi:integrative and conjugative element protein (TIGR02256 family)
LAHQIGATKTDVAVELHDAAMQGASKVIGLFADACDTSQEKVWQTLQEAQLVIDASTTLEYPRLASTNDVIGRHFSVFVTPDGNSAVLLAEDADRSTRLRTLEAQYYRALINHDWGRKHLEGNLATFWSGASCRDISTVMPYSRITSHAGNLAEQVQQAASHPDALIRVWDRNVQTGAIAAHDVPVASERSMEFDELELFIDAGIEEKLRVMRLKSFPTETGGILLGYYDFNINSVVIVDALPAPTDSKSSRTSFERGVVGLATAVEDAAKRTAGVVGYLGEWHSHPPGHSGHPSQDDILQLVYLALGMADDGLPAVSLIVGERDIQILQGEVRG